MRFGQVLSQVTDEGTPTSRHAGSLLAQALRPGPARPAPRQCCCWCGTPWRATRPSRTSPPTLGHLALLREGREPLEAHRLVRSRRPGAGRLCPGDLPRPGAGRGEEVPPEDAVDALARLRELLASPSAGDLDPDPYWAMVDRLRTDHDLPLVRGAATGPVVRGWAARRPDGWDAPWWDTSPARCRRRRRSASSAACSAPHARRPGRRATSCRASTGSSTTGSTTPSSSTCPSCGWPSPR